MESVRRTAGGLSLILGGARSGKSSYAERQAIDRAGATGAVLYVATAEALDAEMARRIAHHRATRPTTWQTVEEPRAVSAAMGAHPTATVVLVDCITLWISNLLLALVTDEVEQSQEAVAIEAEIQQAVTALLAAHRAVDGRHTILVSNEVGMGVVPPYPLGRLYRDLLGRVNMWLAAEADDVVLLVAGLPLYIKSGNSATTPL